jgi:hypothetical protein
MSTQKQTAGGGGEEYIFGSSQLAEESACNKLKKLLC